MQQNSNQKKKVALSKFESMLKTNNVYFFDSTEFEEIIHYYLDTGRQSLANKAIKLGLEQHPTSINLKLLLAETFVYDDHLDEAEKILNELHAIEPNNEEVYIQKANILSKRDLHSDAIEILKIALAYAENEADILAMIGMEYLYLDKFDNARLNFAKCLDVDFEDYSSLYNVVYCFDMQNQHEEAVKYLLDFIDKDPYSEVAWHQLGRQYFILKQYKEALRAFDYAVIVDEFFVGAYLEKAKTLENLKEYGEAIDNYLITIELDDPTAFAYYRIGECYDKMGEKDLSLQFYKKTVKEDPLLDKGWLALTRLYSDGKNYQKALYYINKALTIDDTNTLYWRMYSEINIKLNLFEEAANGFYKCIDFNDENLDIYIGLSDILNFIGDFNDSLNILIKALRIFPNHAEVEYRLACLYIILGNDLKGEKYIKKGLSTDFEYHKVFKETFPSVFELENVKAIISNHIR
ncbi:MAG: tetratricopeptide (TPR) repeat protein [Flavobacteriales bacterium]|jgi:tetratricopeptide (TPR) repeat protein|tara:strand:- start:265 stop:1656 length:1392 start_codon:yes stop_codon:yes gene_type:complete